MCNGRNCPGGCPPSAGSWRIINPSSGAAPYAPTVQPDQWGPPPVSDMTPPVTHAMGASFEDDPEPTWPMGGLEDFPSNALCRRGAFRDPKTGDLVETGTHVSLEDEDGNPTGRTTRPGERCVGFCDNTDVEAWKNEVARFLEELDGNGAAQSAMQAAGYLARVEQLRVRLANTVHPTIAMLTGQASNVVDELAEMRLELRCLHLDALTKLADAQRDPFVPPPPQLPPPDIHDPGEPKRPDPGPGPEPDPEPTTPELDDEDPRRFPWPTLPGFPDVPSLPGFPSLPSFPGLNLPEVPFTTLLLILGIGAAVLLGPELLAAREASEAYREAERRKAQ